MLRMYSPVGSPMASRYVPDASVLPRTVSAEGAIVTITSAAEIGAPPLSLVTRPWMTCGRAGVCATAAVASELEFPANLKGLVVQSVDADGPTAELLAAASDGGPTDAIVSVEGVSVRTESDLRGALRKAGPGGIVTLVVYNNAARRQRVVRVQLQQ